jgi:hypothetical protein
MDGMLSVQSNQVDFGCKPTCSYGCCSKDPKVPTGFRDHHSPRKASSVCDDRPIDEAFQRCFFLLQLLCKTMTPCYPAHLEDVTGENGKEGVVMSRL